MKNISPDEKQLVEIAKALAKDPRILILDEPTASLDFHQVEALFEAVRALKARGVAIVFISHRIWEVAKICDRLVAFRNGETVGELDFSVQPRDEKLIVPLITGQEATARVRKPHEEREREIAAPGRERSRPRDAGRVASGGRLLTNVSFSLRRGEVLGLGGLQGQGQEEILDDPGRVPAGLLRARSAGTAPPCPCGTPGRPSGNGIALIPGDRQKEGLFLEHSVLANLLYPKVSMHRGAFFLPMGRYRALAGERDRAGVAPAARSPARSSRSSRAGTSRRSSWASGCPSTPRSSC